jgi:hypothetical protein
MSLFEESKSSSAAESAQEPPARRRAERLFRWRAEVRELAGVRTLRIVGSTTQRGSRERVSGPIRSFEVSSLRATDSDGQRYCLVTAESREAITGLQEALRTHRVAVTWHAWPYEWTGRALTAGVAIDTPVGE